jgi:hypothetical protein
MAERLLRMNWSAEFDHPPISLPDGRKLKTLADCRDYVLALPKREQEAVHSPKPSLSPTFEPPLRRDALERFVAKIEEEVTIPRS